MPSDLLDSIEKVRAIDRTAGAELDQIHKQLEALTDRVEKMQALAAMPVVARLC
jgi:hypothetical protein